MKIYTVHDSKAEAYLEPFFAPNHAVAERMFGHAVNTEGHIFHACPEDYNLFYIGSFDEDEGKVKPVVPVKHLVRALAVKKAAEHGDQIPMALEA